MNDLYDAADAKQRAPRWRDVADELPQEAQDVVCPDGGERSPHGLVGLRHRTRRWRLRGLMRYLCRPTGRG